MGPAKAESNLQKHGVDFADAAIALEDPLARPMRDPASHEEERFLCLAMGPTSRLLVVVFTNRGDRMRLISARLVTGRERRQYEEEP